MPQHTSTRQTPNTAGAADGKVLPPDNDTDATPTPGGAIAKEEAAPGAVSTGGEGEAGAGEGASAGVDGKSAFGAGASAKLERTSGVDAGTSAKPESKSSVGAETSMKRKSKSGASAGTSTGAGSSTGLSAGAETEADSSTGAKPQASPSADAKSGTKTASSSGGEAEADPAGDAEAHAHAGPQTEAEIPAGPKSKTEPSAGVETEAATSAGAETEDGSSAGAKTGDSSSAGPEAEDGSSSAAETEQAKGASSKGAVDAPSEVPEEAGSYAVESRTAEEVEVTDPDTTDSEAPASQDPDAEATGQAATAEPDDLTNPTESTTPRPTRPSPRSWSSRLGVRRRVRAWREKHPVAALTLSWVLTFLAAVLVYICLEMPNTLGQLRLMEFARIPAEAIMASVILLSLPRRARIAAAACFGALVGAIAVLNMFDMGFNEYLGRHFNIILDWSLFGDARGYLKDTFGGTATQFITVAVIALIVVLIVLVALAMVRLSNVLVTYKAHATRSTLIAGTVWITCSAFALEFHGIPLAADHTAGVIKYQVRAMQETLRDEAEFKKVAKVDAFGNTPGSQLVPDLRGKDMIFTFIESYGRSAIEDPIMAPGVDSTLAADTKALSKAGFAAKSGWLTSATYGGSSWLGHSTTMSGLWVSNQQRYRTVMASDHLSLTDAFKKTGDFDTVGVMPGVQKGWPEQSFYGLDKVYNAFQLGYQGPKFSWSTMPDQYALEQFQNQVHSKPRTDGKSLMSMIILTSSHQPWAPIPKLVPWDKLGNGSIFDSIEKAGNKASDVIANTTKSRQEYGKSIQYSVNSLTQWLERYGNDNTVLVFLGDHQPISRVSGSHASRDVPISIVAKDPKVLEKIDSWNWTDGLRPAHNAPVWKMSAFRDKFLTAYGSTPHPKKN